MKMKTTLFLLLCVVAPSLFASEWIITISGIKQERNGTLHIAVYPGEEGYMNDNKIVYSNSVSVTSDKKQFIVKDLPEGEYSFAILHDEDGDNKMKMGKILPKEGFAYSGKKQPAGMPPKYKNAFITLKSAVNYSSAQMKYY